MVETTAIDRDKLKKMFEKRTLRKGREMSPKPSDQEESHKATPMEISLLFIFYFFNFH